MISSDGVIKIWTRLVCIGRADVVLEIFLRELGKA